MKINIEPVRKKETANVIDFDYEIEDAVKGEYAALLKLPDESESESGAGQIDFISISGRLSQKNGFAFIEYGINAAFSAECARCNGAAPQTLQISGGKYLADKADGKEDNDDYYTLDNPGVIDLRGFMAEFLSLEAPLRYLCGEDCMGLCRTCGKDLNAGGCGCDTTPKNPAFKVLDNFFDN
jgi:uncharacterized protein